ncbi:MAG TPA: serine/threonine-protein kinase, partial [Pirellulaceae bacterium]|nr:serine/threonine-protein kinase [Pirellulaceae bacterium]
MATLSLVESAEAFIETIERSGLISAETMAKVRQAAAKADSAMVLAKALVKDGTLTRWQASQLLYGISQLTVGKFKLLDQLGSGEMGRVYLAEHAQMGRRHSLKVLSRRHTSKPEVVKRFLDEAQQVAALEHPNVSRIYDVNQDGERYYVVMEYVEGQDLQRLVEKSGKLPVARAVEYVRQTAEGLAHAHEHQLVHGDLKPSNLLIDSSGTVKILDIGQARLAEDEGSAEAKDETVEAAAMASAIHHAPEQRGSARKIDRQSDIYSLGSVLCNLLTGKAAANAADAKMLLSRDSQIPAQLVKLCLQMMADKPADRPASMREVLQDLSAASGAASGAPDAPAKNGSAAAAIGSKDTEAVKSRESGTKPKKPPVARALKESAALSVAKTTEVQEDAASEATEAAAAEEEASPFAGFAIQTKGRKGVTKAAVKSAAAEPPAAVTEGGAPATVSAKKSYLPLIIGGAIGGGMLAIGGLGLIVFLLFFRGGDSPQVADASAANDAAPAASAAKAAESNPEANPESNPAAESNPTVEANPTVETSATSQARPEPTTVAVGAANTKPTPEEPAAPPPGTPAAESKPAEETKPAEPPAPAPAPEPEPKPAPAPPKPAPKPAAPADPFVGFAKAVTLPELGGTSGDVPPGALEPKVLGPCQIDARALVICRLKGGEFAARTGRQKFERAAAAGGTAPQDWEVSLVSGGDS